MPDTQLQIELAEARREILRLRERVSVGAPTVHKDLSLVSLVPKFSDSESEVPLEEFISTIESSARIGNWNEADKIEVATLRLAGAAKIFYNGCSELHEQGVTWQKFKDTFRNRFKDVHTDQFHFTNLQNARQRKNESPQQFADRCKALAQKIIPKVDDPVAQRIHRETAERMLLASFCSGLTGNSGTYTRYSNPQTIEQALTTALSVQEAEKQDKFNESFYARFENSVRLVARPQTRTSRADSTSNTRTQRYTSQSSRKTTASDTRNAQTREKVRCYECKGIGHFARDCPTRLSRESYPPEQSRNWSSRERPRRARPPENKPSRGTGLNKETSSQGNGNEV